MGRGRHGERRRVLLRPCRRLWTRQHHCRCVELPRRCRAPRAGEQRRFRRQHSRHHSTRRSTRGVPARDGRWGQRRPRPDRGSTRCRPVRAVAVSDRDRHRAADVGSSSRPIVGPLRRRSHPPVRLPPRHGQCVGGCPRRRHDGRLQHHLRGLTDGRTRAGDPPRAAERGAVDPGPGCVPA